MEKNIKDSLSFKTFDIENLLPWQNILNSRQIATDVEEK